MNIFVAKLPKEVDSEFLKVLFEQHGEVSKSKVITDRDTGESKCYGFVEMPDSSEARKAISELDGNYTQGRRIVVKQAEERKPRREFSNSRY